jgi:hypothetical protein
MRERERKKCVDIIGLLSGSDCLHKQNVEWMSGEDYKKKNETGTRKF